VREQLLREALAKALVAKAKRMAELAMDDVPHEIPPEEARLREQLRQLEDLESQGVPNLRQGIRALRDQVALLRMERIVDPWLSPDYQTIFEDEAAFLEAPDALLRPVLLQFVQRVDYSPGSGEIKVVLR
jgi:hypothetical protein